MIIFHKRWWFRSNIVSFNPSCCFKLFFSIMQMNKKKTIDNFHTVCVAANQVSVKILFCSVGAKIAWQIFKILIAFTAWRKWRGTSTRCWIDQCVPRNARGYFNYGYHKSMVRYVALKSVMDGDLPKKKLL